MYSMQTLKLKYWGLPGNFSINTYLAKMSDIVSSNYDNMVDKICAANNLA